MGRTALAIHPGLSRLSRLPALAAGSAGVSLREMTVLLACGATAAILACLPDFNLRIPGHAILRSVFPMALGLALVPRRGAGLVMGLAALAVAGLLRIPGTAGLLANVGLTGFKGGAGAGAMTSLALSGPLLDAALWGATRGWRLYAGVMAAALGSNLAAFAVRGLLKGTGGGGGGGGGRAFGEWWASASITYPVCGLLAGLISALVWFQLRGRGQGEDRPADEATAAPGAGA